MGWERWVDRVGRDRPLRRLGARPEVLDKLGINPQAAATRSRELLERTTGW